MKIQGSIPAILTPMQADGSLDLAAFRRLLDWHIAEGSDGVVVVGTTGESPTVNVDEHCQMIETAVQHVAKRIPVIAGTGANSTSEAIELAQFARKAGADAHLSVVPYYNKPTQEGLYQHFKAIAEAVDLPLILYNVPGRTVADMSNDTTLRLAAIPGVIGIKDATGNIERGSDLLKRAPAGFDVWSGDDATAMVLTLLGAKGTISVTALNSSVLPEVGMALSELTMPGLYGRQVIIVRRVLSKVEMLHWSPGCSERPSASAARVAAAMRSPVMLPLVSIRTPILIGARSAEKIATSCVTSSS